MEERERCNSFILSRTPHETILHMFAKWRLEDISAKLVKLSRRNGDVLSRFSRQVGFVGIFVDTLESVHASIMNIKMSLRWHILLLIYIML
jgi:hypothetical protein